jgi:hypothetical protein
MIPDVNNYPLTIYPILDLTLPHVSERSRFYPLPAIGIGTPYVESLTSYACRLTAAHSISFGLFYEYLLIPSLNKTYLAAPPQHGSAFTLSGAHINRIKAVNGLGKMAKEWTGLLETLTLRNDLAFLTLSALSDVIPNWKLLRTFQAWCPSCYEEMIQAKQTLYQPLLWLIAAVNLCSKHRRPLLSRCPYCQRQLYPLSRRVHLGYCPRCGYWLGESHDELNAVNIPLSKEGIDWQLSITNNMEELLTALPSLNGHSARETMVESLHECISISTGGVITHFAKLIGKHLSTVHGWYQGRVKIPLPDLLQICYCLNLSILDFLSGGRCYKKKRGKY